jgi:cell wall-associated NlpC family hydrolase
MTAKKVDLGDLSIAGAGRPAGLDDLVSQAVVSWAVEQVAELTITSLDPGGLLADTKLGVLGSTVTYLDCPWTVSAVDTEFAGGNLTWTFRCRSRLARNLRRKVKVSAEKKRSPSQWVTARVKAAGGRAIVQKSATAGVIAQGVDQSELDIVSDLAKQLGWTWVEHSNVLLFGSRYWAWKTGVPGLPTWAVTWDTDEATDAMTADASITEDDATGFASMDLTLPHDHGMRLRPFHRVRLAGFGRYDGTWLVETVTWTPDGTTPVDVTIMLPRKPVPQPAGTTGVSGGTATPGTPRATAVAYALAQVGKPYVDPAHPPDSWDCSKLTAAAWAQAGITLAPLTFTQVNQCSAIPEAALLAGDLVFYFKDAHHVSMYIGGGQIVEAASPASGVRVTSLHNSWNDAHFSSYGRPKGASTS